MIINGKKYRLKPKIKTALRDLFMISLIALLMAILYFYEEWYQSNYPDAMQEITDRLRSEGKIECLPSEAALNFEKVTLVVSHDFKIINSVELALPNEADGSFKTYMDYLTITSPTSKQYALQQLAETNELGFRVLDGKLMVAMGSFYTTRVGDEFRITLDSGKVFDVIIGDLKQNIHTDENNQYIPKNGNIVEFIIDQTVMDETILEAGNISKAGFKGSIIKIEKLVSKGSLV